jgi:hypothetical protein
MSVETAAEAKKAGCNRWRMVVELTFDIKDGELEEKYPGDVLKDFGDRAMARMRPELNRIHKPHGGKFEHYHILETPTPCVELD